MLATMLLGVWGAWRCMFLIFMLRACFVAGVSADGYSLWLDTVRGRKGGVLSKGRGCASITVRWDHLYPSLSFVTGEWEFPVHSLSLSHLHRYPDT